MSRLEPQTQFAQYTLVQPLGDGPLGELWLAEKNGGAQRHVLAIAANDTGVGYMRQPDSPLETVVEIPPHDNLVTAVGAATQHDPPYIVYDDVGGTDLTHYLDFTGALSGEQTFVLVDHLLAGLVHVHDQGICHGDVRPPNVWIDQTGRPRLIHIGLGYGRRMRFATAAAAADVVPWLAPEVRAGEAPGVAADLYGAAMIGLRAHSGVSPLSSRFWRDLHMGAFKPEVAMWFERMTHDDPEQRYATALAAREAFAASRAGRRPELDYRHVVTEVEGEATGINGQPIRARLVDRRTGEVIGLFNNPTTVGRIPGNDIVISLPLVSKRHARILNVGGAYFLEDQNSANGTLVNEEKVNGRGELNEGDTIRIAPTSQNPAGVREYTFHAD